MLQGGRRLHAPSRIPNKASHDAIDKVIDMSCQGISEGSAEGAITLRLTRLLSAYQGILPSAKSSEPAVDIQLDV